MRHAAIALVLAAACTPTLSESEDFYACSESGACPPGYTCLSDGFCSTTRLPLGESCMVDNDCDSGLCTRGPDAAAQDDSSVFGYCSHACTTNTECSDLGEAECRSGTCLVRCRMASDCPMSSTCHMAFEGVAMLQPTCFPLVDRRIAQAREGCTSPMQCGEPGFCSLADADTLGVCTLICDMDVHCPSGERCVQVINGVKSCLRECAMPNDCLGGLTCGSFSTGPRYCMPAGWQGQMLPLAGRAPSGMTRP